MAFPAISRDLRLLWRLIPTYLLYNVSAHLHGVYDGSNSYVSAVTSHAPTSQRSGSSDARSSLMLFHVNTSRTFKSTEVCCCAQAKKSRKLQRPERSDRITFNIYTSAHIHEEMNKKEGRVYFAHLEPVVYLRHEFTQCRRPAQRGLYC